MTYFDHGKAAYDNKCKERYEQFKEMLRTSKNEDDEMLWKHIFMLEHEAEKNKKKVKKYQEFFLMLGELLPRQSSIHDVIS